MIEWMGVEEIAKEMKVSTRTIRNYLSSGKLHGTKVGGQWRFSSQDLYDFLDVSPVPETDDPAAEYLQTMQDSSDRESALLVVRIPVEDIMEADALKQRLLDRFNKVYKAYPKGNREFFYMLYHGYIKVTLTGPNSYVLDFSRWIDEKML
jgi:excisionase family DNA binding protein